MEIKTMTCPKCGNEQVEKLYIAGTSYEEATKITCDKCQPLETNE